MLKSYKYLFFIIGTLAMLDFFITLFSTQELENFTLFTFKVSKGAYLIYKFMLGALLIISGLKTKNK